jgi:ribonuclease D
LAAWREEMAIENNKPRRHILSDESLVSLASSKPTSLEELDELNLLSYSQFNKFADQIIDLINDVDEQELEELTKFIPKKLSNRQRQLFQKIRESIEEETEKFSVDNSIIINKADLSEIVSMKKKDFLESKLFHGWRGKLVEPIKEEVVIEFFS